MNFTIVIEPECVLIFPPTINLVKLLNAQQKLWA